MNIDPSVLARIQFAQPDEKLHDRMVDAIMWRWHRERWSAVSFRVWRLPMARALTAVFSIFFAFSRCSRHWPSSAAAGFIWRRPAHCARFPNGNCDFRPPCSWGSPRFVLPLPSFSARGSCSLDGSSSAAHRDRGAVSGHLRRPSIAALAAIVFTVQSVLWLAK
jgi:hypothetical protein